MSNMRWVWAASRVLASNVSPAVKTAVLMGAAVGVASWWLRGREAGFDGQVVVITGGSRGLGFALAQEFAGQGARLVICGRDRETLQQAKAKLRTAGAAVVAVPCDISSREEAERLIKSATERFGRVDVLVNNAGQIAVGPLESQTVEDFERAMGTMFWGMVYTTMAVLPQMRTRKAGRILNITSIGGKVAVPHLLPYVCAKFAAVGFSEGLRAESARDRIKVTTVVPGLMRTGSHINALFKGDHRKEYSWFSLAATLPFSSMDAHRAARQIVSAADRGDAEVILTPQAKLLALAHGVVPGALNELLGMANRFIPGTGGTDRHSYRGKNSESAVSRMFVAASGRSAERDLNQLSAPDNGETGVEAPGRQRVTSDSPPPLIAD